MLTLEVDRQPSSDCIVARPVHPDYRIALRLDRFNANETNLEEFDVSIRVSLDGRACFNSSIRAVDCIASLRQFARFVDCELTQRSCCPCMVEFVQLALEELQLA